MKKHMPGFVPVNYKQSGKALLTIGIILLTTKILSFFSGWFYVSNYFIFAGIGLLLLSLYLIKASPK